MASRYAVSDLYTARVVLRFEGTPDIAGMPSSRPEDLGTYAEAFHLPGVLRQVAKELKTDVPAEVLGRQIEVVQDMVAGLLRVQAMSDSAEGASQFANTLSHVFIDHLLKRYQMRVRAELERTRERLRAAHESLVESRKAYDAFRELHGVSNLSAEQERGVQSAVDLQARRDSARAEVETLRARVEVLRDSARRNSSKKEESTAPSITAQEIQQLSTLQTELAAAQNTLTDEHPRVVALKRRIAYLRQQVRAAGGSGSGALRGAINGSSMKSAASGLEAAQRRYDSLVEAAKQAQERVAEYSHIEGEASSLLAQIQVNEKLVTDLRHSRAQLQNAMREPTSGFRMVAAATPPSFPEASRKKKLVKLVFPVAAVLLVLLGLIGRELRGFRLRTPAEIAFWGKGPVVASTTWPLDEEALEDFVVGMDDVAPTSQGQTLLVGATKSASHHAEVLARRLSDLHATTPVVRSDHPPVATEEVERESTAQVSSVRLEAAESTGLAVRRLHTVTVRPTAAFQSMEVRTWNGPLSGPKLRRAARLASRVLVVVPSGEMAAWDVGGIPDRIGRAERIGYVVVGLEEELEPLPDRIGDIEAFWLA